MKIIAILLALWIFALPAAAEEMPGEYKDFTDSIPEDVADILPDGFFSEDLGDISDAVGSIISPKNILSTVFSMLSGGLSGAFSMFALLLGLLALSALLSAFADGLSSSALKGAVSYGSSICTAAAAVSVQLPRVIASSEFFGRICLFMNSLLPIMSVLYISGGNTAGAAVANTSLIFQINLIEFGATALVMPAVCACMALTLADTLRVGEGSFSGITGMIKKSVAFIFGLCSTLLTASLSAQSILSSAGDSAGARAVKFVAGNMIPVVGSTVGETLRTLAASVRLLRSTVGVAGIAVLALMILPTVIELFLTRFALNTAAAIGELMGCRQIVKLYRELASLYGYIIAASAMASLLCVLTLTVFAIGKVAIGGI